jgi:hypothetical protein
MSGQAKTIDPALQKQVRDYLRQQYEPRHLPGRELELVAGALELASRLAARFNDRHPADCECAGRHMCRSGVGREVTAAEATCAVLAESILGYGGLGEDLDDLTPGDALRHLADLCDRLDAAHEATPTAVID